MFTVNNYPEDIASAIYTLCSDADCSDYIENKEATINQLTDAIAHIKAFCENDYNSDYWRTLYNALDVLADR